MGVVNRHIFTPNSYRVVVNTVMVSCMLKQRKISSSSCEDTVAEIWRIFFAQFLNLHKPDGTFFVLAEHSYIPEHSTEAFSLVTYRSLIKEKKSSQTTKYNCLFITSFLFCSSAIFFLICDEWCRKTSVIQSGV